MRRRAQSENWLPETRTKKGRDTVCVPALVRGPRLRGPVRRYLPVLLIGQLEGYRHLRPGTDRRLAIGSGDEAPLADRGQGCFVQRRMAAGLRNHHVLRTAMFIDQHANSHRAFFTGAS